jgi:hypothetical protein
VLEERREDTDSNKSKNTYLNDVIHSKPQMGCVAQTASRCCSRCRERRDRVKP